MPSSRKVLCSLLISISGMPMLVDVYFLLGMDQAVFSIHYNDHLLDISHTESSRCSALSVDTLILSSATNPNCCRLRSED